MPIQIKRPRPGDATPLSQLSAVELQQELARRVKNLETQRETLTEQLGQIEVELAALGFSPNGDTDVTGMRRGPGAPRGRKRPNERPLVELVVEVLDDGTPRTTSELAQAALDAGYITRSRNFTNSVGVALYRDERFTKKSGRWVLQQVDS